MRTKILWLSVIVVAVFFGFYTTLVANYNFQTNKIYKVGILISGMERLGKIEGLKEGLETLGYIEGMNVEYILKNGENNVTLVRQYAKELDEQGLDIIVAGGAIETQYLKNNRDGKTPIVFLGVPDAIQLGFIESYKRPGGRITGVENAHVELSAKRLQLFRLLIPSVKRVFVIFDENIEASRLSLDRVKETALELEIEILPISVKNEEQFLSLKHLAFQEHDGLLVLPSFYLEKMGKDLGEMAIEQKLPIFGINVDDVQNRFLMSYGVSYFNQGYQGANMVIQILKGSNPSEIPVEKPDTIKLLVNSETEKLLGVQFSEVGNAFINRINPNH